MPFVSIVPAKRTAPEFLDLSPESYGTEELEGSLADIRLVNRYLGDRWALLKHLAMLVGPRRSFSVLDIATGSADMPVAIAQWAEARGMAAQVTGIDINEQTIAAARRHAADYPQISLQVADGLNLPYADRSFDYVLCSKALHHLNEDDALRLVREMLRVARRGYLIMDLRRSWIAYSLIYLLTRIFTRNRLTRYDGPLSVLKSFAPDELATLASTAGASRFILAREPFWLLVLAGRK